MKYDKMLVNIFFQNFNEAYGSAKLLNSSFQRMQKVVPIKPEDFSEFNDVMLDMVDAFRVRYSDLQDAIGNKVFKSLLLLEEESIGSNVDVINKMEKRGVIDSFESFKRIRNIRNAFSHDYPDTLELKAELLNSAFQTSADLINVLNNCIVYACNVLKLDFSEFKKITV